MLETKDLILKKGEYKDWQAMYHNLWKHKESAKYMLWTPLKFEEDAQRRMKSSIEYQQCDNLAFFVYEKKSNQAIGFAGMKEIGPNVYEDTGIAIGPDFVGQGYGKQIVNALITHAFEQLGASKFVYSSREQNTASKRLAKSCGFVFIHTEEKTDPRTGKKYVLEFYESGNGTLRG